MDTTISPVPPHLEEQHASVTGLEYNDFQINSTEEADRYEIISDEEKRYPEVAPAPLKDEVAADRKLKAV
jgi:hypothetical protein